MILKVVLGCPNPMIDVARALSSTRLMKALTGLSPTEFQHLLPRFEDCLQTANPSLHQQRQRAPGAGRKHTLADASGKLFFSLFFLKCYPTFDLASFFFGVNRSQWRPTRWVPRAAPIAAHP